MSDTLRTQNFPPKTIWLLLGEGDQGETIWCDDPDPVGRGEIESVKYIRADTIEQEGEP